MSTTEWELVLDAGAVLGEGPCWDVATGTLLWVDIEAGVVHRTDVTNGRDTTFETGAKVGFVVPRAGGGLAVGLPNGVGLLDGDGSRDSLIEIEADRPETRLNDGKCDPVGRLWTGTMTDPGRVSALYRVDPDRSIERVATEVGISNGLGWSADGNRMYYIDTPTMRVDVFDYDVSTGAAENRRAFVEVGPGQGYPDGMTMDAEDHLWVAFWDGWCLRRYDPTGHLVCKVDLPVARPTSAAFGGAVFDDLFVTTVSRDLTPAELTDQPHAGGLLRVETGVRGVAAVPFSG